jgi:hypothetical protein
VSRFKQALQSDEVILNFKPVIQPTFSFLKKKEKEKEKKVA